MCFFFLIREIRRTKSPFGKKNTQAHTFAHSLTIEVIKRFGANGDQQWNSIGNIQPILKNAKKLPTNVKFVWIYSIRTMWWHVWPIWNIHFPLSEKNDEANGSGDQWAFLFAFFCCPTHRLNDHQRLSSVKSLAEFSDWIDFECANANECLGQINTIFEEQICEMALSLRRTFVWFIVENVSSEHYLGAWHFFFVRHSNWIKDVRQQILP